MKSYLALIVLVLGLAFTSVNAQVPTRLVVSVPFDFTAGKSRLKAGTYTIHKTNATTVSIRSGDGSKTVLVSSPLAIDAARSKGGLRLVFNRYGGDYFLSQIWLTEENGKLLYPSKEETTAANRSELAKNIDSSKVEVAIRARY